jgi:hypothetical protein
MRVAEEEGLVGEVRERLRDPDYVELCPAASMATSGSGSGRGGRKELAHLLSIELDEAHSAAAVADGDEAVTVCLNLIMPLRATTRSRCSVVRTRVRGRCSLAQPRRDLHLLAGDGNSRDGRAEGARQEARGAAYAAAYVEDAEGFAVPSGLGGGGGGGAGVIWDGQARDAEKKADEVELGGFLGFGCFGGVGGPVAVVDVLAPFWVE